MMVNVLVGHVNLSTSWTQVRSHKTPTIDCYFEAFDSSPSPLVVFRGSDRGIPKRMMQPSSLPGMYLCSMTRDTYIEIFSTMKRVIR